MARRKHEDYDGSDDERCETDGGGYVDLISVLGLHKEILSMSADDESAVPVRPTNRPSATQPPAYEGPSHLMTCPGCGKYVDGSKHTCCPEYRVACALERIADLLADGFEMLRREANRMTTDEGCMPTTSP